jgi:tetratricopeptide (TPR) repeat protein
MNPKDKYFAQEVKKLEDDLLIGHKKLSLEQLIKTPDLEKTKVPLSTFDDDWVQVNFSSSEKTKEEKPLLENREVKKDLDDEWVMNRPTGVDHPILKEDQIRNRSLEDDFYADEFEEEGDIDEVNASSLSSDTPIVSHTLIDLYCAQHYYDKAIELLEKILELNPDDLSSRQKLVSVKELKMKHSFSGVVSTEEAGHNELISIIENQVKVKSSQEIKVEYAFDKFLNLVKDKASHYR